MRLDRWEIQSMNSSSFPLVGKYTEIARTGQDGKFMHTALNLSFVAGIF